LKSFYCKYRFSDGGLEAYPNTKKLEERSERFAEYSHISFKQKKCQCPPEKNTVWQLYDSISSRRRGICKVERGYQECSEKQYKKESESQKQFDDIHIIDAGHFAN
jgi:hypothetical protein